MPDKEIEEEMWGVSRIEKAMKMVAKEKKKGNIGANVAEALSQIMFEEEPVTEDRSLIEIAGDAEDTTLEKHGITCPPLESVKELKEKKERLKTRMEHLDDLRIETDLELDYVMNQLTYLGEK